MNPDKFNISIIYGSGAASPALPELLRKLPQVNVTDQSDDVVEFLKQPAETPPDSMVVYLDGVATPPEWIEDLTYKFPQAPVLVCSERLELDFMMRAMQLGVREILPLPLSQETVEAAIRRMQLAKKRLTALTQSTVVVVTGHKGGVGTTTIAINLAVALSECQAERCALVDLGRPFPDIGNFLDHDTTYDLCDVIHNLSDLDQSFFKKILQPYGNNLEILHGISDFKEQDSLDLASISKIFTILRGLYKYIVVDLGHLFDELFFRVFRQADLVLMLTELNVPNFRNLRKLWPMLREWDPLRQKVKIVVNRNNKGNDLGMRELKKILEGPPFTVLPSDNLPLIAAINQGVPLAKVSPRSKLYASLKDLARKIIQIQTGEKDEALSRQPRRRFWIF
jgi:pilus assembly protein CpaE